MTCEVCELLLAQDEASPEAQAHVAGCPDCRSLAMRIRRGHPWWKWSSPAAALILTSTAAWFASRPAKPPQIVSVDVNVTGIVQGDKVTPVPSKIPETLTPVAYAEPLTVKMLTPDPDVVIYWLVDAKGD
jgi:hypothetical protein